jgi:hypothetical protein
MKPPTQPEEQQEPNPKPEALPNAGEPSKRKPKVVVYQGIPTHNSPADTEKKTDLTPEGKSESSSAAENPEQAAAAALIDRPQNTLPKVAAQAKGQPVQPVQRPNLGGQLLSTTETNPGRRLHAFESAAKNTPNAKIPWHYRLRPNRERIHRAYWDVTGTISLIINVILVCVLVVMALQIKNLKTTVNSVNALANNMLGGLYGNFVQMDQASITTIINVDAQIPLNFSLPVSQNTQVVLTSDVSIPGAHVVINTGVLNINAQANVTLPAGTSLPIALNMDIPVQTSIPISIKVPVNIPLNQTDLHQPFTGLQTTLRPLYCALNKNAQYPEGTYICAEHDVPTPGVP